MTIDIAERRRILDAERTTLVQERVDTINAGKKYDNPRLTEIDSELDALNDIGTQAAKQRHTEARVAREAHHAAALAAIPARETERYTALAEAEQAAIALAEALAKFQALSEAQIEAFHDASRMAPQQLYPAQIQRRLSEMLVATIFSRIAPRVAKFGMLSWRTVPPESVAAWAYVEQRVCANAIAITLNNGEISNDTDTADQDGSGFETGNSVSEALRAAGNRSEERYPSS